MLLLGIDTSGRQGSIALARAGERSSAADVEVLETVPLTGGAFSAQLVPQIAALLSRHGFTKGEVGAFAVVSGPGSFTGLRIGLAAVKALAVILKKPITAVSLLEACIFASGASGRVMAALDAGRSEVYVGEYDSASGVDPRPREFLLPRDDFLLRAKGWNLVTPESDLVQAAAAAGLAVAALPAITAATVAALGWRKLQLGQTVTPELLEANYIRRTDAEIEQSKR